MTDSRTLGALSLTILFWASAFAGIRSGLTAYSPGSIALFRLLVASAVLTVYFLFSGLPLPKARDLPLIAFCGLLGIALYHLGLNYGEVTVTAGSAGFLISSVPIFSALLAAVVLREKLSLRAFGGIGMSFAGIALISMGEGDGAGISLDAGAMYILLAAIATSIFFVIQKPYLVKYGPILFTAYIFWAGTAFLLVFLPDFITEFRNASAPATLSVIYLGVFPTAIAYVTWAYALSRAPVSNVASFMYVVPVLGCFIAWLWLGELPTTLAVLGGVTALAGVALVNTGGKR
ncbi:MAG: DMT family transporter [Deltaproteobacteria bacterium]